MKCGLSLGAAAFLTFAGAAHTPLLSSVYAADISVDNTMTTWEGGNTYVVDSDVTIDGRITVNGAVTLELREGKTLTAVRGIGVQDGNSLIIEGDGTLYAGTRNGESWSGNDRGWSGAGIGGRYENGSEGKNAGTVIINGGRVFAFGGDYGAGIGGGGTEYDGYYHGGTVSINGGIVKAVGGYYGAGIGGGAFGTGGVIGITGGTVTATGGYGAAGIGGGSEGGAGEIVISGGNVTALGGSISDWYYSGAGIGTGYHGEGGSISISGENTVVEATGGSSNHSWGCASAGIGGGSSSKNGCDISISGGTVLAVAGTGKDSTGKHAPGIGAVSGSSGGSSGKIRISGGTVSANGFGKAPGIGIAYRYSSSVTADVILSGGTITAIPGGDCEVGIGAYKDENINTTETLEVTGDVVLGGDLTVRKLNITGGGKLTVPDGKTLSTSVSDASEITIAEGGSLENHGTLLVKSGGTVNCSGEMINDNTLTNDGTITKSGEGIIFNQGEIKGDNSEAVRDIMTEVFTVTFNTLGGDSVSGQKLRKNELLTEPVPSPEKRGHTFTGWYTDENATVPWDFSHVVTRYFMTLYAGWDFNGIDIEDITGEFIYSGSAIEPEITAKDKVSGNELVKGSDYTLEYRDNVNAGTAAVILTGKGDYQAAGEIEKTFSIQKMKITPEVKVTGSYTYTGREIEPEFTVMKGDTILTENDYKAELSNNVDAGTATLLIKETSGGNYEFEDKAVTFTIEKADNPAVITSSAAVSKGGKTLDLSKLVSGAEGKVSYEITGEASGCSVDSDTGIFTSGNDICVCSVTVTIDGNGNYRGRNGVIRVSVSEPDPEDDPKDDPADKPQETDEPPAPAEVPFTDPGQVYASPEDNFAPIAKGSSDGVGGSISKLILDFSKVDQSGVKPSDLKMTVIAGSKLTADQKLKDEKSFTTEGGVKVKVNKKTLIPGITCKGTGKVTMTMDNDVTYTVSFTAEKPKAMKDAKMITKGGDRVEKTVFDLFGTHINSGKLEILKQKHSQAALSGNSVIIDPKEDDGIKLRYRYLNKKYKITVKVK